MHRSPRRTPMAMDHAGPWAVSVADTPHTIGSYNLYIKTPTHNLTLTRSIQELVDLDSKLHETIPGAKLPHFPIDPTLASSLLPSPPPKRKSTFFNTLTRLASPAAARTARQNQQQQQQQHHHSRTASTDKTGAASSTVSPTQESPDPFDEATESFSNGAPANNNNKGSTHATAIAAYLTSVSNDGSLNESRVWRRFVRVRTDDLESRRVERAIKHVRSDLAAHTTPSVTTTTMTTTTTAPSISPSASVSSPTRAQTQPPSASASISESGSSSIRDLHEADVDFVAPSMASLQSEQIQEEDEDDDGATADQHGRAAQAQATGTSGAASAAAAVEEEDDDEGNAETSTDVTSSSPVPDEAAEQPAAAGNKAAAEEDAAPSTPTAETTSSRLIRSRSADPDRASRLSRVYTNPDANASSSQAGDTSSVSTTAGGRSTSASGGGGRRRARTTGGNANAKEPGSAKKASSAAGTKPSSRKVMIDDFEMMRVLGKGCAGKVLLVRHRQTQDLFALKAITKRHVLAHQELQHTLTEQAVLKKMSAESKDPFVVKLWWSFHDKENLFLVMDFHPGGDLATQLARWGRLGRDRARFYAAEIVEGVEGLHAAGVIYRDLKPENILIGGDGHIVLTDFGLSKEFPRRTANGASRDFYASVPGTATQPTTPPWMRTETSGELATGWPGQPVGHSDMTNTFCGTAEYLAPEVIQGLSYSYEVDWWSFGTMLYEMLTGITPFWANNHSDMYVRVLQDELHFPDDRVLDHDTKSLIRGLLQRNPALRMAEPRIKKHPYFSMIDWTHVYYKRYIPPYIPPIDPSNASDTQNFDETFLDMEPVINDGADNDMTDTDQEGGGEQTDTDRTDGDESSVNTPSQSRSSSVARNNNNNVEEDDSVDVFDGYSFKGRHSVLIDEDDEEELEEEEGDEEVEEEEEMEGVEDEEEMVSNADDVSGMAPSEPTTDVTQSESVTEVDDAEAVEPKTPEARPHAALPDDDYPVNVDVRVEEEEPAEATAVSEPSTAAVAEEAEKPKEPVTRPSVEAPPPIERAASNKAQATQASLSKGTAPRTTGTRTNRNRREKSGVPALDKDLSDTSPDTEAEATEHDVEDDDWDFVERADGEDRNGARGTSLFARGVVDRYRLAVFRKASTPAQSTSRRTASGMSKSSSQRDSMATATSVTDSPTPSEKTRRGRNAGLPFRKQKKQFLRQKSPPPSIKAAISRKASAMTALSGAAAPPSSSKSFSQASSAALASSLKRSSSTKVPVSASMPNTVPPSLKTQDSEASGNGQSQSYGQVSREPSSMADEETAHNSNTLRAAISPNAEEPEKTKTKKVNKYKEGAEKVLSLFQSPRQQQQS